MLINSHWSSEWPQEAGLWALASGEGAEREPPSQGCSALGEESGVQPPHPPEELGPSPTHPAGGCRVAGRPRTLKSGVPVTSSTCPAQPASVLTWAQVPVVKVALADQCWLGLQATHGPGGSEWGLRPAADLTLDSCLTGDFWLGRVGAEVGRTGPSQPLCGEHQPHPAPPHPPGLLEWETGARSGGDRAGPARDWGQRRVSGGEGATCSLTLCPCSLQGPPGPKGAKGSSVSGMHLRGPVRDPSGPP